MAQLKSTIINGNLTVSGSITAKNGNKLENIGTVYYSSAGNNITCTGGHWTNTPYTITLSKGSYMITLTASPQCKGILDDWICLGASNTNCYEQQCTFSLSNNNSSYYPRCTHSFFYHYSTTTTVAIALFTFLDREFHDVEIAAVKLSDA